MERNYY